MYDPTDRTALVTGSTKGIGRAIAQRLVDDGAKVIVHGRDADEVAAVRDELKAHGGVAADLASQSGVDELLEQLRAFDPVDLLVNNAGVFDAVDFVESTDEQWQRYHDVNVMSAVRVTRALLPGMLERDHGSIVNVSSEAGVKPIPQMIPYSVSKAAMTALGRGVAELTKGTGVTVNTLLPGPTWTDTVAELFEDMAEQAGIELDAFLDGYFRDNEPTSLTQRFADPAEVADGAAFLLRNSAANGTALRVEGGIIRTV